MRSHEERREEQAALERRCALLVSEGEETRAALESAERARKALEPELQEANEKYGDLNNQVIRGVRPRITHTKRGLAGFSMFFSCVFSSSWL